MFLFNMCVCVSLTSLCLSCVNFNTVLRFPLFYSHRSVHVGLTFNYSFSLVKNVLDDFKKWVYYLLAKWTWLRGTNSFIFETSSFDWERIFISDNKNGVPKKAWFPCTTPHHDNSTPQTAWTRAQFNFKGDDRCTNKLQIEL